MRGLSYDAHVIIDRHGLTALVIEGVPFDPDDCEANGLVIVEALPEEIDVLTKAGYSLPRRQ